jgi:hypothetical protein
MNNDKSIGINVFGASASVQVDGLDKPLRAVGRGLKSLFGLSKKNIHRTAVAISKRTE